MKEFIVLVEKDTFDKDMRILQVSHNGGAGWSTIAFYSNEEALKIIAALQQGLRPTPESVRDLPADVVVVNNALPAVSR